MSGLAIALSQTIIYWTLLILLISWIIIFAILALRPESSSQGETEGRAHSIPSAPEASAVPQFQTLQHLRSHSEALQAVGVAVKQKQDH